MKVINYPAMASPPSISCISEVVGTYCRENATILDPFCGTGRLLIQPRNFGHSAVGVDCSPIALLAAKVLHQKVEITKLDKVFEKIINQNLSGKIDATVTEEELFWFYVDSFSRLITILMAIDEIDMSAKVRRVFWLALADASRKVSYIRDNEYKLHRMKPQARSEWKPYVEKIFSESVELLVSRLKEPCITKEAGAYKLLLGDIADKRIQKKVRVVNCVVTSPPYGDSRTTVGYGQFAKIPLLVMEKSELFRREFPMDYRTNLDSVCLGGTRCHQVDATLSKMDGVIKQDREMERYFRDYFVRLEIIDGLLRNEGLICLVLGNRVYKGKKVPLIEETCSYLKSLGYAKVRQVNRMLAYKRLPRNMRHLHKSRVRRHDGMNYESIVCFKKG